MNITNLPFGSEFSPSQINLQELLDICQRFNGQKDDLEDSIRRRYFHNHSNGNIENQKKLAMNCRLGLKAYLIVDENCNLTEFGELLANTKNNTGELYTLLAKHILLNLNGLAFIQCLRDMAIALEDINLTSLRSALAERGIYYPSGGKHPSMMRLWLEKAGVIVGSRWQVDEKRVTEILQTDDDYDTLRRFTPNQRAFLLALANTGEMQPQSATSITKLAEATYGVRFPEKSLPKEVLNALEEAGYIHVQKTTTGRGAKPFDISPTSKLIVDVTIPILEQLKDQVDPKLIDLQRKSLGEILHEIDSDDRYTSGLALEALAFKLMRYLGMDYVATRLRAQSTGGAEVDLIFESTRLVFSRWQIQCKNTTHVSLDDVAKEVGLTHFLKSNVIIVVSTGSIGTEARRYSNKIMKDSNLSIVLLDKADLDKITANISAIVDVFHREARNAMELKKMEL